MHDFFANPRRLGACSRLLSANSADAFDFCSYVPPDGTAPLSYKIVGSVGIVPIEGALASACIPGWYWYADITYENIIASIDELMANPTVDSIILSFNSPGGTVTGCAETAQAIKDRCQQIEIVSHCRLADSAAYWLASATDKIFIDPAAEVGSIGVILTHTDMSKMLEEWGIKITHIFSGDHKADGSPYQPLSDAARARLQADIDYLRGLFVEAVANNRGIDREGVDKTEALTYIGQNAVDILLADEVRFYADTVALIDGDTESQTTTEKETTMARKGAKNKSTSAKNPVVKKAETGKKTPAAAKEGDENEEDGEDEGDENEDDENEDDEDDNTDKSKAAAQSERTRIGAILSHPEAEGRGSLANYLAMETDMTPEAAGAVLAKAEKGTTASGKNAFETAMEKQGNPDLGGDGKGEESASKNGLLAAARVIQPPKK